MSRQNNDYLNIRINKELKKEYVEYCDKNGYSLSKRIKLLLELDLKEKLIINE
jgi:antitoxin component of RelBE/YafQ-DinJ toxin-antitoxin module